MRYIITHGHIFKNAGSTFDHALEGSFAQDFLDHRDDDSMRNLGAVHLGKLILENPNLKAISSHHLCNPLPKSEQYQCLPVYFIRHPIERIISVYTFERKQNGETPGAEAAAKYDLLDYIKWRFDSNRHLVISNYQVTYIGQHQKWHIKKPVTINELKVCLANHIKGKCFLGLVEEFEKSFEQFKIFIHPYFPEAKFSYETKNVSSNDNFLEKLNRATDLLGPVLDTLYSHNAYDLALYDYTKAFYSKLPDSMPEVVSKEEL